MNWLISFLGMDNASGHAYLAWSGWGSDVAEAGIFVSLGGMLKRHNCHVPWCPRIGRFTTAAGELLCHKHSPIDDHSHAAILVRHREALSGSSSNQSRP